MLINKIKIQSNIFFRLISLNRSETMFSKHKFHNFRRKNYAVQQLLKKYLNGIEQLNFLSLSTMAKSIRSGTDHNNKRTIPCPNSRRNKNFIWGWGGDPTGFSYFCFLLLFQSFHKMHCNITRPPPWLFTYRAVWHSFCCCPVSLLVSGGTGSHTASG